MVQDKYLQIIHVTSDGECESCSVPKLARSPCSTVNIKPLPLRVQTIHADWFFGQRSDTETMSQSFLRVGHVVIRYGSMGCHTVIPEGDGTVVPFDADLEVGAMTEVLMQMSVADMGRRLQSDLH